MMKKIILALALCTLVVEHSFAIIPPLLKLVKERESLPPRRPAVQDEPIESTCELLIGLCASLAKYGITSKESAQFKKFIEIREEAIRTGAFDDCVENASKWIHELSTALDNEVDTPKTALANEMLRELLNDIQTAAQSTAS